MIKIGDRLRCVHPHHTWLKKDHVYVVKDAVDDLVELEGVRGILWNVHRFQRAAGTCEGKRQPPAVPG